MVGFTITFGGLRLLAWSIHIHAAGLGNVGAGGVHRHHYPYGILQLTTVSILGLVERSPRMRTWLGLGAAGRLLAGARRGQRRRRGDPDRRRRQHPRADAVAPTGRALRTRPAGRALVLLRGRRTPDRPRASARSRSTSTLDEIAATIAQLPQGSPFAPVVDVGQQIDAVMQEWLHEQIEIAHAG